MVSTERKVSNPTADAAELIAQAEKLANEGRSDKALAALDAAILKVPNEPHAWQAKASLLFLLDQSEDAFKVVDTALEQIGEDGSLLWSKGRFHFAKDDFVGARETFDRLIAVEPRSSEGWFGKGLSLLREGHADRALECAERALECAEREQQLVAGHVLRGDSLLQLGRWSRGFCRLRRRSKD